jgi:hypothetical protein
LSRTNREVMVITVLHFHCSLWLRHSYLLLRNSCGEGCWPGERGGRKTSYSWRRDQLISGSWNLGIAACWPHQ